MKSKVNIFYWILRVVAAFIMLQTMFFKFTSAPETIYIFETVGLEPLGRYASGVAELIASILLLMPRTTWLGAIIALGVMAGAIISHLTILGIVVQDDGGTLFIMALIVTISTAILLWANRGDIPIIGPKLISESA